MATTTTRRRKAAPQAEVEKALVSVPAPRSMPGLYSLGVAGVQDGSEDGREARVNIPRRERMSIYYEMYRQHPTVRAAVEKMAKVATSNGYTFYPEEQGEEVPEEQLKALKRFFRLSNAGQLLRVTYKDLLIYAEGFWLIVGAKGGGRPQKAMRLHPMYMDTRKAAGLIVGWRYGPVFDDTDAIDYELGEIVHFKMDDPNNDVYGLSLLDSLMHTVASDLFAMRYNRKFFENAAQTGVIFVTKNATEDEVGRNREWLEANYVGADNAHRPLLLEGDIDVKKSVSTPQEMQFIEGRKFNRQEILSVLDISPSKLGFTEDSNRSTSKEDDNSFRQESVASLQVIVEEEISNALILGMFKFDSVLFKQNEYSTRDLFDRIEVYGKAEDMGAFSPNEIRSEFGRPKVDGGDEHFVQTAAGLIPLDLIHDIADNLAHPPQPAAPAGTAAGGVGTRTGGGTVTGRGRPGQAGVKGHPGTPGKNGKPGTPGGGRTPGSPGQK